LISLGFLASDFGFAKRIPLIVHKNAIYGKDAPDMFRAPFCRQTAYICEESPGIATFGSFEEFMSRSRRL
jgi:hypothetical protein